ncbi:Cytochrome b-c1 complex subunit 9 [Botryosphaeria dothidea]|uniref:Complex III subunit 9 n=1 Tax=Botryosphaeria dothidea TaxID=55169 RepID=A0A8H4N047_9PEZI|nr:Cytochrome b-c1 complex subunit 9 [Botryosphaeria dothidea]
MAGVSPPACPAMLFVPSTDASIAARFLLLQASFLGLPDDRTSSANTCASSLFKRNTIFLTTVFVSAFGVQLAFDTASDRIWDSVNKGRQWKDVKYRYVENDDE